MSRHSLCFKPSSIRRRRSVNFACSVWTRICIRASSNLIEDICRAGRLRNVLLLYSVIPLVLHLHILDGGVYIRRILLVIATGSRH